MKATLILLNVLIVSLLNAGNPIEEAGSKHKNAEAENRKKQLIQTLENSDAKLYYEEDFPGKDAPPKKNARVNGEKISGNYVKFGVAFFSGDGWKKGEKYVFRVIPYIKGNRDGVEIYYRPDATISERHWYEKGIFKKAESYDTNGKWDWRRDEDGKSYFNN